MVQRVGCLPTLMLRVIFGKDGYTWEDYQWKEHQVINLAKVPGALI